MSNPVRVDAITTDATTTGAKTTFALSPNSGHVKTFTVKGSTSNSTGASVCIVEAALEDADGCWETLGTVTLTLGTTVTSGSFTVSEAFAYVRLNVSSISGTGAKVSLKMGSHNQAGYL